MTQPPAETARPTSRVRSRWLDWIGPLPTGAKVFLILSAALAPFAAIAFFASVQTTRNADAETRARLQSAVRESAASITRLAQGDVRALASVLTAFVQDPDSPARCARAEGAFAQYAARGGEFALFDSAGNLRCGSGSPPELDRLDNRAPVTATLRTGSLELRVAGAGGAVAVVRIPASILSEASTPAGISPPFGLQLTQGNQTLALHAMEPVGVLARIERQRRPIGIDDIDVELAQPSAALTSSVLLTMLLPIFMWLAAAAIAWLVVDTLLIRPLRGLRRSITAYRPGEVLDLSGSGPIPAEEIRELGESFRDLTRTVQLHEADLAEGLVRQTRLTREVHHRVKNNLQVIASLINFHARGAPSPEATRAYTSIQRRVDALAAVHRYHYAELEENRGLELRSIVGELASNIRATVPETVSGFDIGLEVEPVLVSQDAAVAIAFLLTELIELAMAVNPGAAIAISTRGTGEDRAILRISSPALVDSPDLATLLESRYGRVIQGLVRQLRSELHHEPLAGAYELSIAILGRS